MGASLVTDIKPWLDIKPEVDALKHLNLRLTPPWPDPIGPVKLDAIDWIVRSYINTLPAIARHIEAIEVHLEQGLSEGKPFIRPQERPSVGGEAFQELTDSIMRLNERLDSIEKKLK